MAAGTLIQLKRKAGAFTGGQLAAGEAGVDTTNGEMCFSANGSSVVMVPRNPLQVVIQQYNPSAVQDATTTFVDLSGSSYSFTPKNASSTIVYEYNFLLTWVSGVGLAHFKLLCDGSEQTESNLTVRTHTGGSVVVHYFYSVASWGTSAKTLKMQVREWSSHEVKLFGTYEYDGSIQTVLNRAHLRISEII